MSDVTIIILSIFGVLLLIFLICALIMVPFAIVQQDAIKQMTGVHIPLKHVIFLSENQVMQLYGITDINVNINTEKKQ